MFDLSLFDKKMKSLVHQTDVPLNPNKQELGIELISFPHKKQQQNFFRLSNFLIYPSNDTFKNYILPFLNSQTLLKCYMKFSSSNPNLSFKKILPADPDAILQNIVIDLHHTYDLYRFKHEYSNLKPILMSKTSSVLTLNVMDELDDSFWKSDSICALFKSNKIFPLSFHQGFLAACDEDSKEFFVALEETPKRLKPFASGTITEIQFPDYLDCLWKSYNVKGKAKLYWDLNRTLTDFFFLIGYPKFVRFFSKYYIRLQIVLITIHMDLQSEMFRLARSLFLFYPRTVRALFFTQQCFFALFFTLILDLPITCLIGVSFFGIE
jgi:hypothetical protein